MEEFISFKNNGQQVHQIFLKWHFWSIWILLVREYRQNNEICARWYLLKSRQIGDGLKLRICYRRSSQALNLNRLVKQSSIWFINWRVSLITNWTGDHSLIWFIGGKNQTQISWKVAYTTNARL